ncbi:MAG: permease-like cell division protein FtsX [Eubacteriales bacterium]|nr:permease-like cell division protein FtsX [Eubacteriales bacterium]
MRFKAFLYIIKDGFKNLGVKKVFTFASIMTTTCTVFIFLVVFSFLTNATYIIEQIENKVGIQVFFDEGLTEEEIQNIANENFKSGKIKEIVFTSSHDAWEKVKQTYFDGDESLIQAFEGENPLQSSASYTIYLYDIEDELEIVDRIGKIKGVRKINYFADVISIVNNIKNGVSYIAYALIGILSFISFILISNTILLTAEFRREENEIKKLVGATNFMVRGPFLIEALIIAVIGTLIPLITVVFCYNYFLNKMIPYDVLMPGVLTLLPIYEIIKPMASLSFSITVISSLIVSFLTVRSTVRV